jgi:hypothetical protein
VTWHHHQKNKSRWNVYSFSEVLRLAGLEPRPIQYCSNDGRYHDDLASVAETARKEHAAVADLLGTTGYFRRLPSLIIDGIRSTPATTHA